MVVHLTPITAKDELYGFVHDSFAAYLISANAKCEMRWQGKLIASNLQNISVRFSVQTVLSTLKGYVSNDEGRDLKLYETSGLFFGHIEVTMSEPDAFRKGDLLATALRDIVADVDTPSGMWLRNARFNELPNDSQFYKWNVVAELQYDEVK